MNKKFFTLLVALFAMISYGASAAIETEGAGTKFVSNKTYMLGTGHTAGGSAGRFIYVDGSTSTPLLKTGEYGVVTATLSSLRSALWTVKTTPASGATAKPLYSFVNVATGVVLTLDAENAVRYDYTAEEITAGHTNGDNYEYGVSNLISGDLAEWMPTVEVTVPTSDNRFYVSAGNDKVIVLDEFETSGNIRNVIGKLYDAEDFTASIGLALTPYLTSGSVALSANELNTQMGTRGIFSSNPLRPVEATLDNYFNLDLTPKNTVDSYFTHTLQARAVDRKEIAYKASPNADDEVFYMEGNTEFPNQVAPSSVTDPTLKGEAHYISMYLKGTDFKLENGKGSFVTDGKYTSGEDNGKLKIVDAVRDISEEWYTLYSKEAGKYIVADTSYVDGTAQLNNGLIKFDIADLYNAKSGATRFRHPDSYLFQVEYTPSDNSIRIICKAYVTEVEKANSTDKPWVAESTELARFYSGVETGGTAPYTRTDEAFNFGAVKAGSTWANYGYESESGNTIALADNLQLYGGGTDHDRVVLTHAKLVNEVVYTLGSKEDENFKVVLGINPEYVAKRIPSGLYLLKVVGSTNENRVGRYWKRTLDNNSEFAQLEKRQNFHHMPSAQWVVESSGSSNYPSFKATNREFENTFGYGPNSGITYQVRDENDNVIKDQFFFFGGDTLEYTPVTDKSATLGYKYIEFPDGFDPNIYQFRYLHELAMDKPVTTTTEKDSALWVDSGDGAAIDFRAEKVLEDTYGYTGASTPQLKRIVYRLKVYQATNFDVVDSYVTYNTTTKKYYLTKDKNAASLFFLKENNEVEVEGGDNICYYTFLEAKLIKNVIKVKFPVGVTVNPVSIVDGWVTAWTLSTLGTYEADGGRIENMVYDADFQKGYYVEAVEQGGFPDDNGGNTGKKWIPKVYTAPGAASGEYRYLQVATNQYLKLYRNTTWTGYSWYAKSKVSVDNNSLSLVNGILDDAQGNQVANSAFSVEKSDKRIYRKLGDGHFENEEEKLNVVKFYSVRNTAARAYLYEDANSEYSKPVNGPNDDTRLSQINFLGFEGKGMSTNAAMNVRYIIGDVMPQYLISVDEEFVPAVEEECPVCHGTDPNCDHNKYVREHTKGRFLVNLRDSVDYYGATTDAGKKFTWDNGYTRLAFVPGILRGDSLIIDKSVYTGDKTLLEYGKETTVASKDTINLIPKPKDKDQVHSPVLFSFRLIDQENDRDFYIESESWKDKNAWTGGIQPTTKGGWIKIQNGVPVIVNAPETETFKGADIFNLEVTDEDPTSNAGIEAGSVSVIAGQGYVTIKGAAGQQVIVANILGQVIANKVLTMDEETVAAPAGVVVVSVGGTATKALVK